MVRISFPTVNRFPQPDFLEKLKITPFLLKKKKEDELEKGAVANFRDKC